MEKDERNEIVRKDMNRLSWFTRFVIWIKARIGSKSFQDLFLVYRIRQLKKEVNAKYPGITGFETRDLSPRIAEEVFSLYSLTIGVRNLYKRIWTKSEHFEKMFMSLLESRIPSAKKSLADLVPVTKLEELYSETSSKEAMRNEVLSSLDSYINSVSNGVFTDLENDLASLYSTKDIVLYHFVSFFQLFHFTPMEENLDRKTYFKNASAMLCLNHLEQLHYALSSAASVSTAELLKEDILLYLTELGQEMENEELADLEQEPDKTEERAQLNPDVSISNSIQKISKRAAVLLGRLPFEPLLRYFLKDPYYTLVTSVPELRLKDLYVSVLRLRASAELEKTFPDIRRRVIEQRIEQLFSGKTLLNFRNYREYTSIDYKKLGLPFFAYTKSVSLLYNYIHWFYGSYIREAVQILDRGILSQNRITRDRLMQHSAAVEDMGERIKGFDYSLSPDSEDGKLFQRLRFTLAQDASHQKMYRTLVLQKDREVQALLDRGLEALSGLQGTFEEILGGPSDNIKSQLNSHFYMRGSPMSLAQILQERKDHIRKFKDLLSQVVKLERG